MSERSPDPTLIHATILGCGSSGGVPRLGGADGSGHWGACDPTNPKNRRRRCSLLLERFGPDGATRALIDVGPDAHEQLLDARISTLDGVLLTHDHADHLHGLDDLRQIVFHTRRRLDIWADAPTRDTLLNRFSYAFVQPEGSAYPPILTLREMSEATVAESAPVIVDGAGGPIAARPFEVDHGGRPSLGFRVGGLVYLPDVREIPEPAWPLLDGLEVFIIDALRYAPHPSHANLETALDWIARARPQRAFLTNMHVDLDYATVDAETPSNVAPAYDGMRITTRA